MPNCLSRYEKGLQFEQYCRKQKCSASQQNQQPDSTSTESTPIGHYYNLIDSRSTLNSSQDF